MEPIILTYYWLTKFKRTLICSSDFYMYTHVGVQDVLASINLTLLGNLYCIITLLKVSGKFSTNQPDSLNVFAML